MRKKKKRISKLSSHVSKIQKISSTDFLELTLIASHHGEKTTFPINEYLALHPRLC